MISHHGERVARADVGIDLVERGHEIGQQGLLGLRGADDDVEVGVRTLVEWVVDGGPDLLVQAAFAYVVHYADDLPYRVGRKGGVADLLADGVLAGEVFAGQGLVDDQDLWLARVFRVGKESTTHQAGLQSSEVFGGDLALVHLVVLAIPGMALDSDPGGVSVAGDGQAAGNGG